MRQSNLKFLAIALSILGHSPIHAQSCDDLANIDSFPDNYRSHFPVLSIGDWYISNTEVGSVEKPDEASIALLSYFSTRLENAGTHLGMIVAPPRLAYLPLELASELPAPNLKNQQQLAYQNYVSAIQKAGIVAPDLSIGQFPEGKGYYFKQDNHWTADGAFWSAIQIRDAFDAKGIALGDLGAHVSMQENGEKENNGSYAKIVAAVCGRDGPEKEYATKYDYTLIAGENTEAALFGDTSQGTSAVAVGTSFLSGPEDNFNAGGALSYALDTDVVNRGIISGALDTSMIDFLTQTPSTEWPDFVIWEFPFSNGPDALMQPALRQFIGLMEDPCDPEGTFTQSEEVILSEDGSGRVLIPLALEDIVEVHAPGLGFGDITLGYKALDGTASSIDIHRSDRLPVESQKDRWVTYVGDPSADDRKGTVITLTNIKVTGNVVPDSVTLRMCSSKLR